MPAATTRLHARPAQVVKTMLQTLGHTVVLAWDGSECIEKLFDANGNVAVDPTTGESPERLGYDLIFMGASPRVQPAPRAHCKSPPTRQEGGGLLGCLLTSARARLAYSGRLQHAGDGRL